MNYRDALVKMSRVLESCETQDQLDVAKTYCELLMENCDCDNHRKRELFAFYHNVLYYIRCLY